MPSPLAAPAPALVARALVGQGANSYLQLLPSGAAEWTADAEAATVFASMREATRTAMRLPSMLRAFSLPRGAELTAPAVH
jgi:hypothetical protein